MFRLKRKMARLSRQTLLLVVHTTGIAVTLLIAGAGYVTSFATTQARAEDCQQSILENSMLLDKADMIVRRRDLAETEVAALSSRLRELTSMIPDAPLESQFLAQLTALSEECQLSIRDFQPGPVEQTENLKQIRVRLSGHGSWECVCRFLDGLQALPRLTHISRLKMTHGEESGVYPVDMELTIFFAGDSADDSPMSIVAGGRVGG